MTTPAKHGERRRLRDCGTPDQLADDLAGKEAGEFIFGCGPDVYGRGTTGRRFCLAYFLECWKIIEPDADPMNTLLEFSGWGRKSATT